MRHFHDLGLTYPDKWLGEIRVGEPASEKRGVRRGYGVVKVTALNRHPSSCTQPAQY